MSHKTTLKVEHTDTDILEKAAQSLNLECTSGNHKVQLYQGPVDANFSVQLPGWKYRVAVTDKGYTYDNYNGSWGKIEELHKFSRQYNIEMATEEMETAGLYCEDQEVQENGDVYLYFSE